MSNLSISRPVPAKLLADSVTPEGNRLTTFELTYPRMIHSEIMTHREASRNAASSRAIPVHKMIKAVTEQPALPVYWGRNQSGMQAGGPLDQDEELHALEQWLAGRDLAVQVCRGLVDGGLHKQISNRVLEPWMHITVIISLAERGMRNLFGLRCHKDAQPEFQHVAFHALDLWLNNEPQNLDWAQWHMPMAEDLTDMATIVKLKVATGRIARVSYLTHEGQRDPAEDIVLHDRLKDSGHWSPFEHCAQAIPGAQGSNFGPHWLQYRKTFANECQAPTDAELRERLVAWKQREEVRKQTAVVP